jgi:murein DD-endopeptidase MepM/ murein hydrolase activator NlpD
MDATSLDSVIKLPLSDAALKKAESLAGRAAANDATQRRKVAQEFASFLYSEVLKAMRAALPQDGVDGNQSLSRDFFTSMMDGEVARSMARRDSTGFTKAIEKSLERINSSPSKASEPVNAKPPPPAEIAPTPATSQTPAAGVVSSSFGVRADPISGGAKFHQGVDIAAPAGTPVKAAAAGRVRFSGRTPGYGNLVEVDHGGGWVTRYGHNSTNLVNSGDHIDAGQALGLVGHTGRATGDHLHFEVRRDGQAVDPRLFLGAHAKGSKLSSKV